MEISAGCISQLRAKGRRQPCELERKSLPPNDEDGVAWIDIGAGHASDRLRRILPVPVGAGERPFTEPTTAVRRQQRDIAVRHHCGSVSSEFMPCGAIPKTFGSGS